MALSIALIGVGYIGKIHLRLLLENPNFRLTGIYDIDRELSDSLTREFGVHSFGSLSDALAEAEAVDIATPSSTHFTIARQAVALKRHVFVEKPVTSELADARALQSMVNEAGIVFQVGHVERFNPAFVAAKPYLSDPAFIEVHRLAQYNARGTDVSVVLDLMMHDIDLILSIVNAPLKSIHVSGTPLVSATADLANARLEFDNGCVANITTNRVSLKNSRKFKVFTKSNLVNIDLLEKKAEVVRIRPADASTRGFILDPGNGQQKKEIVFEHPVIFQTNAINEELNTFHNSIASGQASRVGIDDAVRTLEIAFGIEERLGQQPVRR
jgi:predicted dehydrogenase